MYAGIGSAITGAPGYLYVWRGNNVPTCQVLIVWQADNVSVLENVSYILGFMEHRT